jgi:glutathione S-transferase-like protein
MNMQLYVTYGSPYARLARIIVIEKALEDHVEIIKAKTRTPSSPYYLINPSGRVPYLVDDAGSAWKTASSSAPISTDSMVGHAFTMRRTHLIGRIFGWNLRRVACATASPYGVGKWPGPRTSAPQLLSPMSQRAPSAWQISLRTA